MNAKLDALIVLKTNVIVILFDLNASAKGAEYKRRKLTFVTFCKSIFGVRIDAE